MFGKVAAAAGITISAIAATETPQALRADAARNRERIVKAAAEVFAERGLEASTAEIAQRAGVGEATLFRRFANKEELIDAILELKMDESIELIAECAADPDPARGLERFFTEAVAGMSEDVGFSEAYKARCMTEPRFYERRKRAFELLAGLLRRAKEAGAVREDLQPTDIPFLLSAAAGAARSPLPGVREDIWKRYLGVILDGLRPEGATKLSPGAPPRRVVERPPG